MNNNKIKTHCVWLVTATSVFTTCLLLQVNYLLLVPLVILFFTLVLLINFNLKAALINVVISAAYLLLTEIPYLIYDPRWMNNFYPIVYLRQKISLFYDRLYLNHPFASNLFKLVLLNVRNKADASIYKTLSTVSVIHLFVVSGFHLNLVFLILTFGNKHKKFGWANWIAFSVCLFYGLMLNLTFGILRSLITLFLAKIQKFKQFDARQRLAIAVFSIIFVNHSAVANLGFEMSCLGTLGCLSGIKTKSKLLDHLFTDLFASILIAPIIICLSHKFNIISFAVILFFSPVFYFIIFYVWFFSGIGPLVPVSLFVVDGFHYFFDLLSSMKMMIYVHQIKLDYLIIYYWIVLSGFMYINLKYEQRGLDSFRENVRGN